MRRIYLDHHSTTPVDPRVVQAMLPFFTEAYGNPHSDGHCFGWEASDAVERARRQVAQLIGADAREIVLTAGATESCSIVLRGACRQASPSRSRIVTVATEHACVLGTCAALAEEGLDVLALPVGRDGLVDLEAVRKAVDERTLLVSVMAANNEIGVIQPLREIGVLCRASGALLHTDATQAVGRVPIDVRSLGVDFLSCSAHKLYGPKGIGALFVRWGASDAIRPIMSGGQQEGGLRPGTVAVPLVVGFGEAARLAATELERDMAHAKCLAALLLDRLREHEPGLALYGHPMLRLPGSLNVGFPGVPGEEVVHGVGERLAVSTGSACSSATAELSHVLAALDPGGPAADQGVRIGIGRFNEEPEMEEAATLLAQAAGC